MQVNSINNLNFTSNFRSLYPDKIADMRITKDEIFSVKSRLRGAYLYEKDCLTDLRNRGLMDSATFAKRINEIGKFYTKKLKENGINI